MVCLGERKVFASELALAEACADPKSGPCGGPKFGQRFLLATKSGSNGAALFNVAGKSKDPERDLSALSAAARAKAIEVMGQLGKLGDETFPARILEYVGLRSKMYSILTVQPNGARKEKRKIKGVPKKAVTNVRHLEYREVLEEGSERRAAFAQLRSRAHEIAVETVEKKSLSPFNDKVYGLDAHNSRPLGHWRNLEQLRTLGA